MTRSSHSAPLSLGRTAVPSRDANTVDQRFNIDSIYSGHCVCPAQRAYLPVVRSNWPDCRNGTTMLTIWICTGSSFWFSVVVRTLIIPWVGRDFEGLTSSTSLSMCSSSPGRTGRGQRNSSKPAPTRPPAGFSSLSTRRRIVRAAVCQPLAAKPWKIVSCAASSLR